MDPDTLELVELGSGVRWGGRKHVGDVDGDGAPDLVEDLNLPKPLMSVRASSTGVYTGIPGWADDEYAPKYAWSVGDLNHDGYDDLVVGQRRSESVELDPHSSDTKYMGPAQLYLGSPTGIRTEPLWTLFAPDHPNAGVGRGVAALPEERAVVVTVVTEGEWYGDFSPELLGVIRDADTPYAYFDELVEVPEFTPGGFTPYLEGWMDDGAGGRALAMVETVGSTGVQWIPWRTDGSGFQPNANGVAVPSRWWTPPGYQVLDTYLSILAYPVGRQNQAIVLGLYAETGYQLIEWGRPLDQLGIPAEGVTAEGCTFTASAGVAPGTSTGDTGTGGTGGTAPVPPTPEPGSDPSRGCGCATRGASGLAGLLALLGGVARRRRASVG